MFVVEERKERYAYRLIKIKTHMIYKIKSKIVSYILFHLFLLNFVCWILVSIVRLGDL